MKMNNVLRSFIILTVFSFIFMVGSADVFAAGNDIAVVNMQELLAKYNKVKKINDELAKEKNKRQDTLDVKQRSLKRMKDALDKKFNKLSENDKRKEAQKLEKELRGLQNLHDKLMDELRDRQAKKYKELENDIIKAVKSVAKAKKIDMVLEKGVVFVGGRDITRDVLNKLNGRR